MKTIGTMLVVVACTLFAREASAQVMNFTADPDDLKQPDKFRADRGANQTFPAGSAVWMTLFVNADQRTVGNFAAGKMGATPADQPSVKVTVSLLNQYKNFDELFSVDVPIAPANMNADNMILPIIADNYDPSFPGFDNLITRLELHKKGVPLQVKVRVESKDPQFWSQNGFFLDESHGLGRFQAWIDQKHGALQKLDAAKIPARTHAVRAFRSMKNDTRFEADALAWFKTHTGGRALDGVKVCSDLIIVRDQFGFPSEKQLCALYTYEANHKCWAQMRRLSYRRVGKDTYDKDVVDSTYDTMHIPVGDEQFVGAREYEISCK
jgi:hypothetical protein